MEKSREEEFAVGGKGEENLTGGHEGSRGKGRRETEEEKAKDVKERESDRRS